MDTSIPRSEQLAWLASAEKTALGLTLAAGRGFVTLDKFADCFADYGSVDELRAGEKHGYLLRASTLVMVQDAERTLYLMVADGEGERRWTFPGTPAVVGETPLQAAWRALTDNVGLAFGSNRLGWGEAALKIAGESVTYLCGTEKHEFTAHYAVAERTYEFFYPVRLALSRPALLKPFDLLERGRAMRLFNGDQMSHMAHRSMTPGSEAIWAAAQACGASEFLRTTLSR